MNATLRSVFLSSPLLVAAVGLPGCYVEVGTLTRFEGTVVSEEVAWSAGMGVHVVENNGGVKVSVGASSDRAKVKFLPFCLEKSENRAACEAEMEEKLTLEATYDQATNAVLFRVKKGDGARSTLGADVEVELPAGFDGYFDIDNFNGGTDANLAGVVPSMTDIQTKNGHTNVTAVSGPFRIDANNGPVSVTIQALAAASGTDTIVAGNGNLTLALPVGASGAIVATSGGSGQIFPPDPFPADWKEGEGSTATSASYSFGAATAARTLELSTENGDIVLNLK